MGKLLNVYEELSDGNRVGVNYISKELNANGMRLEKDGLRQIAREVCQHRIELNKVVALDDTLRDAVVRVRSYVNGQAAVLVVVAGAFTESSVG